MASVHRSAWEFCPAPASGVHIIAEAEGLAIQAAGHWSVARRARTTLGRRLPGLLPQLVEMGMAAKLEWGYRIPYDRLVTMRQDAEIFDFEDLAAWVPWPLEIETSGNPGAADFRSVYRFYAGAQPIYPERRGCFLRLEETIYQLDPQTFALVEAMDEFARIEGESRTGAEGLIAIARIKGLAEEAGAELDRFLRREVILVPSQVEPRVVQEAGGRISLAPSVEGAPREALQKAFFASDVAQAIYAVDGPGSGRIRVVFNEAQREAVRRMQRARHLGGLEKAKLLRDPAVLFDGVADSVRFGPRVRGIGDFPFVQLFVEGGVGTGIFDGAVSAPAAVRAGLRCRYADGSTEDVRFASAAEAREFCNEVRNRWERGDEVTTFRNKTIIIDDDLQRAVAELEPRLTGQRGQQPRPEPRSGKYLLILRNDGVLDYEEPSGSFEAGGAAEIPRSLHCGQLKPHQIAGLRWLQRSYRAGRRGCLLADEMGLGKTLQTLAFLAWLLERGETATGTNPEKAPWRPILIVAPLTLIEMENWRSDMRRFFSGAGAVFQPWLVLHSESLKSLRTARGDEVALGAPVLDAGRLRENRVVFTNYETVVRYQHSFACPDLWSVVVTDEAQKAKTPDTKVSHALKSLSPRFRIGCTGTPVETRLLDLWNIMDYLQPGPLLGSAKQFQAEYRAVTPEETAGSVAHLRPRLRLGAPDAFVLHREKALLTELPAKHEHVLACALSLRQRSEHLATVAAAHSGVAREHPFALLARLFKLYQHPAMLPRYEPLPPGDLVDQCPKLGAVIEQLRQIRRRGEKVLIFTRSIDMQQILQEVIQNSFDLRPFIVNGVMASRGDTRSSRSAREEAVTAFQHSVGFDAIILSPEVAGLGLNLCEANHVIHYGRWWNPAKEAQATDRVYRIGQTRDVHVYLPIATDPQREFESFDEKLDKLLRRRRQVAADFLAPAPSEDDLQSELLGDVAGGQPPTAAANVVGLADLARLDGYRFEALVSLLQRKAGAKTVLTPRAGDDKADVISLQGTHLQLIQCKRVKEGGAVDVDALMEVRAALDIYRHRHLREVEGRCTLRLVVCTNGTFTLRARRSAREHEIELVSRFELGEALADVCCTEAEIELEDARRVGISGLHRAVQGLFA